MHDLTNLLKENFKGTEIEHEPANIESTINRQGNQNILVPRSDVPRDERPIQFNRITMRQSIYIVPSIRINGLGAVVDT